ncbi:hypothetical protein T190820D02B_20209 [Tenacibaculum sp. 190524A05c]
MSDYFDIMEIIYRFLSELHINIVRAIFLLLELTHQISLHL